MALSFYRATHPGRHYHICDHSNAPFSSVLPAERTSITCHDVLAIEAASGITEYGVRPTGLGRYQQRYIRHYLLRQRRMACVSAYTLSRVNGLKAKDQDAAQQRDWRVIPNAFNADFHPVGWTGALATAYGVAAGNYLFHLGSSHARKNRPFLLRALAASRQHQPALQLVLAGQGPTDEELSLVAELDLAAAVVWAGRIPHERALALYSHCYAFVFPSLSEGFGWPLIEAQACGAPVVCSRRDPMPEVAGEGALYADPTVVKTFADAIQRLSDGATRGRLISAGRDNAERFRPERIIGAYVDFITQVA